MMTTGPGPVLFVGATSKLGAEAVPLVLENGLAVRAMTRTPAQAERLRALGATIVRGDLRDPDSLRAACAGAEQVVAAAHAMTGQGRNSPRTVDGAGNRELVDAAVAAGVERFVFVSALGASDTHSIDFFRIKLETETYLKASGLEHVILRPCPFMETWAEIVGLSIGRRGRAIVFGRGDNPINFVSVKDVARFVLLGVQGNALCNETIEIGGPKNLTMNQVVAIFEESCGRRASTTHVPRGILRVLGAAVRPVLPVVARMARAGLMMDTEDCSFDATATLERFPMRLTRLEELAREMRAG